MAIVSFNPAIEKMLKKFHAFTPSRVERILKEARQGFFEWRDVSLEKRAAFLQKAANVLRQHSKRYAAIMTQEMGKPLGQSLAEVEKCAWVCEYFAKHAASLLKEERIASEFTKSYIRFDPLGLILGIMPWNFPFWQFFRFATPALMAGNVTLLKHASNVPQSALAIGNIFKEAGFPKGVVSVLLVESSDMEGIIADDRIAGVSLTGSEGAGRSVAALAGKYLKKTVLELGGSDAFIILKDADIELAARAAVQSRVINTGQSCIAAKRFIVEKPIENVFTEAFVAAMRSLRVGDPMDVQTHIGPLARKDLRDELSRQVNESIKKGARLLLGGKRLAQKGFFFAPTVLANVAPGMPAYEEELFGPVASIITANDANDALRIANDSRFGLGANIWTKHIKRGEELAKHIEAGVVVINDFVKSDPRFPFGGVKKSGYGRELGSYGIREFTNIKTVVVK